MAVDGEIVSLAVSKQSLQPEEFFTATIDFEHDPSDTFDQDDCIPDLSEAIVGKEVRIEGEIGGVIIDSQQKCVENSSGALNLQPGSAEYTLEFRAPATPGDYTLLFVARRGRTERFIDSQFTAITVEGDTSSFGCTSDADCPDGFRCVDSACIPEQVDDTLDLGLLLLLAAGGVAVGTVLGGGGDGKQKTKRK